jgi:hypothetical protein
VKQLVNCDWCGLPIEREAKRIKRNIKIKSKNLCSKECKSAQDSYIKSDEYTTFRHMHSKTRFRSKKNNHEFSISLQDIKDLWIKQCGTCAYTGEALKFGQSRKDKHCKGNTTASLDRIDSTKGYVNGNIQIVHVVVNFMKHVLSDEEFVSWCQKVAAFRRKIPFDRAA